MIALVCCPKGVWPVCDAAGSVSGVQMSDIKQHMQMSRDERPTSHCADFFFFIFCANGSAQVEADPFGPVIKPSVSGGFKFE